MKRTLHTWRGLFLIPVLAMPLACTRHSQHADREIDLLSLQAMKVVAASGLMVELAKANLQSAEANLASVQKMRERGVASDAEVERAQIELRVATLRLEAAEVEQSLLSLQIRAKEIQLERLSQR